MKKLYIAIIIVFILFLVFESKTRIRSEFDDFDYKVYSRFQDKDKAVDKLVEVNYRIFLLLKHLRTEFKNKKTLASYRVFFMLRNFDPEQLQEHYPLSDNDHTAYTENKQKIALCLRNRNKNFGFYDINQIMFVAIHELAHTMTRGLDHTIEFWENFKFLINHSVEIGIYRDYDYGKYPFNYCGLDIYYSPTRDPNLRNIESM